MPKKNKKKRRGGRPQRPRTVVPPPAGPVVIDLPRGDEPLIRLEIDRAATPQQRELAERYWTPDPAGGWAEPVAELGTVWRIASDLEAVCTAYLLRGQCSMCESPVQVANRSRAAALGGNDLRRIDGAVLTCAPCRQAHEEQQAEQQRIAREREQAAEQKRREALMAFLELGGFDEPITREERRVVGLSAAEDEEPLGIRAACLLYAMVRRARAGIDLPARSALPTGWLLPSDNEAHLLKRLYWRGWIRVDVSADAAGFCFNDEGGILSFYLEKVPYRLVTSPTTTWEDLAAILLAHSSEDNVERIREEVRTMEMYSLHIYLHGLLMDTYDYPPVPEARVGDLYEELRRGLKHFTYGQMVCLCWRAVDTAAAWKERKGLPDSHASSAAVTILDSKINYVLENRSPLPEYQPHYSHLDPPGLESARALLTRLEERIAAREHCKLHQSRQIPCSSCLGMLYAGGEDAEEVRKHFAALGDDAIWSRPDLATKAEIEVKEEPRA